MDNELTDFYENPPEGFDAFDEESNTTNRARANRAASVLNHYASLTGGTNGHESLVDLLVDLRHWCYGKGIEFGDADEWAEHHFEEEVARSRR